MEQPENKSVEKQIKPISDLANFVSNFTGKEVTLFSESSHPFSFKPFDIVHAFVILLLFGVLTSFFIPPKLIEDVFIKTASVKQSSAIVAGKPVQWSLLVKKSDITKNKYLAKLPKSARNIKISSITATQAKNILSKPATVSLNLKQKKTLAIGNQPKKFFAAGLLDGMSKFFISDLGDAVTQVIQDVANPDIQTTPDSTTVDLTSQAQTPAPVETPPVLSEEIVPPSSEETAPAPAPASSEEIIPPAETPGPSSEETAPAPEATTPSALDTTKLDAGIASAKVLITSAVVGTEPGEYAQSDVDTLRVAIDSAALTENPSTSSEQVIQSVIDLADANLNTAISKFKSAGQVVKVEYQTSAPVITEQTTDTGKLVTVAAAAGSEDPSCGSTSPVGTCLTDVLAFTNIPEIYKVGQESKIHIKWKNNGNQEVAFHAYDTNGNGKLDYVEWTVPHLSDQTFEIIFISKAFELDENQNIVSDIYDLTSAQDQNYATVSSGHYVRATFNSVLDNSKDITIYARPTAVGTSPEPAEGQTLSIEVFPVYTDVGGNQTEGAQLSLVNDGTNPDFSNISADAKYRILLKNLLIPTDVFDLKIQGGSVDFDYIVDPTAWLDGWSDRKKITISNTNVDGDLTDFPILVQFANDADLADALDTGYDVRFTDSGGSTLLSYERESWSGGGGDAGTGIFWVKVPNIYHSPTADQNIIYVYYGNPDATDGQDAVNVWDSDFKGVWHLPNGSSLSVADSTGNNSGTNHGVGAGAGQIDGAGTFNGSSYVDTGSKLVVTDYTIDAWINLTDADNENRILSNAGYGNYDGAVDFVTGGSQLVILNQNDGGQDVYHSDPVLLPDVWTHVAATYNSNSLLPILYIDGLPVNGMFDDSETMRVSNQTPSYNMNIGANGDLASFLTGSIDEVRISDIARPAEWTKFEYHNMSDSGNNLTFAAQELISAPTAPSACEATRNSDTNFSVAWTDNSSNETGFYIERKTDGTGDWAQIDTATASPYSDTTTSANHSYQYRVRAYNAAGNSNYSTDTKTYYTTPAAPGIYSMFTHSYPQIATYVSDNEIDIKWTNLSNFADGFKIERSSDQGTTWTEISSPRPVSSPYADTTVIANNAYVYRISACVGSLCSESVQPSSFMPASCGFSGIPTTPSAPTGAAATRVNDTQFNISWTNNAAFASYLSVERQTDDGGWTPIYAPSCGATTYSDTTTSANHKYSYRVKAVAGSLSSGYSAIAAPLYTSPGAPTIGTPTVNSTTAITWNWTDNSNYEDSFGLAFDSGGGTDVNNIAANSTSQQTTGLSPNKSYSVHVSGYRADTGAGSNSETSNAVYTFANAPASLVLFSNSQNQMSASWQANSNPDDTQYYIENTTNSTNSGWINDLYWASSSLTCGTSYSFSLKAKNGDNVVTDPITASAKTSDCPSTQATNPSGGGVVSQQPAPQTGGFSFLINNGALETASKDVSLNIKGSAETARIFISNSSDFSNAQEKPYQLTTQWTLTDGDGPKTVYIKFISQSGISSDAISSSITLNTASKSLINQIVQAPAETVQLVKQLPQKVSEVAQSATKKISEVINNLNPNVTEKKLVLPPVADVVQKEVPISMQNNWPILPTKPLAEFNLAPLPKEISFFAEKFPQIGQTFRDVGIEKITDITKLQSATIILPGLADAIAQSSTASVVPVAKLSSISKGKIPSGIVFARSSGELVDYNITLSITGNGAVDQHIETTAGNLMRLVYKPENPAKSVTGYITFKSNSTASVLRTPENPFAASLLEAAVASLQQNQPSASNSLVLSKFDYKADKDGIYTADIQSPVVNGQYDIITVVHFNNPDLSPTESHLLTVVDPEGYVYRQLTDGRLRIGGAVVSIYWFNPGTSKFELWPASKYQQANPQVTDDTGKYSFLVPPGKYYIKVEATNYVTYTGDSFVVSGEVGVFQDVPLEKNFWMLGNVGWQTALIFLAIVFIIVMFAISFYNLYKNKKLEKEIFKQ